jgi:hypothetical protein
MKPRRTPDKEVWPNAIIKYGTYVFQVQQVRKFGLVWNREWFRELRIRTKMTEGFRNNFRFATRKNR